MTHKIRANGLSMTFVVAIAVVKVIFMPCAPGGRCMIRGAKRCPDRDCESAASAFLGVLVLWLWSPWLLAGLNTVEEDALTSGLAAIVHQGIVIELGSAGSRFKAVLYRNRQPHERGLMIYLPEAGQRLDAGVIQGLRRVLPDHGWSVLSLQLPVLEVDAREEEYLSLVPQASGRIDAAVARMKTAGMKNIALLGHGYGFLVALDYLRKHGETAIRALALLSPWWPESWHQELQGWLAQVKVPVLDVYAERDRARVLMTAGERHRLLKGREGYRQWRISGTGHHYRGLEESLAKRIFGWLQSVAPGREEVL